jgi:hypothetical protein
MRRRTLTCTAAVLASLAALAPAAVHATDVTGWIGGDAARTDYMGASGGSTGRTNAFNLAGSLNADGYLGTREDFDWSANAGYGANRASLPGDTQTSQNLLTYGAHAGILDSRRSSFRLRLNASRAQSEFSETPAGQEARPGSQISNSYGAEMITGGGAVPILTIRGGVDDSTFSGFAQPDNHRKLTSLDAGATHGTDDFNWALGYSGRLDQGSLSQNEYISHYLTANGTSRLAANTNFSATAQYFTRTPRTYAPFNPKYDDANVSATLTGPLGSGFDGTSTYGFSHFVLEGPGLPSTEQTSHVLNAYGARAIAPEWTFRPTLNAGYTSLRTTDPLTSLTVEDTGASQALGAQFQWNRTQPGGSYSATFQASGGASEAWNAPTPPSTERTTSTTGAGGAGVAGNLTRNLASGAWGAGYSVDYSSNLGGIRGWALVQSLTANFSRQLGIQSPLSSTLTVTTTRNHSDLIGDGATRIVNFATTLGYGRQSYALTAYLNDGVAPSLSSPVRGDGLVVPFGYDVRSRGAVLSVSSPLSFRWDFLLQARYGMLTAPQVPEQREFSTLARIGYRIGQFTLSLEDTYRAYGTAALEARYNTVMVMFARSFRL